MRLSVLLLAPGYATVCRIPLRSTIDPRPIKHRWHPTHLINFTTMDVFQVDDKGQLFISPAIESWEELAAHGIDTVIDLEGGLDEHIPTVSNHCLYVYFPFEDDNERLPCMLRLRAIAKLAATLIAGGHRVLSHCGMGYNRSAFVAGLILIEQGMSGDAAVARLRERRPGALFNDGFAACLTSMKPAMSLS